MAHPMVDKIQEKSKALALRHGEKAAVAIGVAACLWLVVQAIGKPSIDLTPDDVQKYAEQADQNLKRRQNAEDIVKKLEDDGMNNPDFEKAVDSQEKASLDPRNYKVAQEWISPEPGAGLIRDTPELIAAASLYAYPGRGGSYIFDLDDAGKRIKADPDERKTTEVRFRRKRRRNRMMGGGGGGMGMMGGRRRRRRPPKSEAERVAEAKAAYEQEKAYREHLLIRDSRLTAKDDDVAEKAELEAEIAAGGPWKESLKGLRWVSVTGVLDHKKMRDNYQKALKRPEAAHPYYKRIDVQRQELQPDGTWSTEWTDVDDKRNLDILDNLTEVEEELTLASARLDALVDPLPFLEAGYWEKVHIASLVPKERRDMEAFDAGAVKNRARGAGAMNAPGMMGMLPGMRGGGGGGMMGGGPRPGMMGGMPDPDMMMMGGGPAAMMRGGGGGFGMGGGAAENLNFEKSQEDTLMVRTLDFTIEPDATYRYRLRLVVFNPNYNHDDVNAGVDKKSEELYGPWTEPTNAVTMPADIMPYAIRREPNGNGVLFQILRWDPKDGVTVVRDFPTDPGFVVGDSRTALIPVSDGSGYKNRNVDFNSRQIVLDAMGGFHPLPQIGVNGMFEVPAPSLLVRPDGGVVLRTEAHDATDDVRQDIARNYRKEVEESAKRRGRQSSLGARGGMGGGAFGNLGAPGGAGGFFGIPGGSGASPPGFGTMEGTPGVQNQGPGLPGGTGF